MKRFLIFILCLALNVAGMSHPVLAAPAWPAGTEIAAEAGIVMDARSGAVLYGKNIHLPYYPASITKIMTALIIIENCDLDEIVTFSHDAVYGVESGSSSAGMDVGDQLTVRECLYTMLLKSANEVANALAEHAAGSISAFSKMMNDKAAALGCTDTHFNNPSGLNDPRHYTSAYDMALIAQAAFQNETFVEIDSSLYCDIPATKRNPDGFRVYPGHRMMKKNTAQYYPGIIGGKTGYTSMAGNTLVTCAERDGMKLITVVLNGHQTHYTDTKALLDFGFANFRSLNIADLDTTYSSISSDLTIAGLPTADLSILHMQDNCRITLPNGADFSDARSSISYELPATAPERAIARIAYQYNDRQIGAAYLLHNESDTAAALETVEVSAAMLPSETAESNPVPRGLSTQIRANSADSTDTEDSASVPSKAAESDRSAPFHIPGAIWVILVILLVAAALGASLFFLKLQIAKREEIERAARYQRRQQRLIDSGISPADFDQMLQKKRRKSFLDSQR